MLGQIRSPGLVGAVAVPNDLAGLLADHGDDLLCRIALGGQRAVAHAPAAAEADIGIHMSAFCVHLDCAIGADLFAGTALGAVLVCEVGQPN